MKRQPTRLPLVQGNHPANRTRGLKAPDASLLARLILPWFRAHARDLPWRRTRDPYAIWISEIMLQQTQVATVVPFFNRWMNTLPTVESLARATLSEVLRLWSGLGYYRRARLLHASAQEIVSDRKGELPDTIGEWLGLPGVGRYTAGAICSIAFNAPAPIVDGNVIRVLARLHAIRQPPRTARERDRFWSLATSLVQAAANLPDPSSRNCSDLNESLMELGATVCTPASPRCDECPLRAECQARGRGDPLRYPAPKARPRPILHHWTVLICTRRGRHLVQQRPEGALNAGLWEFPTLDSQSSPSTRAGHQSPGRHGSPLFSLQHSITRYRISVDVIRTTSIPRSTAARRRWLTLPEINGLPLAGLHRKIARRLARG